MNRSSVLAAVAAVLTLAAPAAATVWRFDWSGEVSGLSLDTTVTTIKTKDRAYASFRLDTASATPIASAPGAASYAVKLTDFYTQVQRYGYGNLLLWDVPTIDATLTLLDDQGGQDGYRVSVALGGPTTTVDYSAFGADTAWSNPSIASDFRAANLPTQQLAFLVGTAPAQEQVVATVAATVDNLSALPEPASWAMMVTGFGVVGMGLRRGRRIARTVAR